MEQEKEMNGFRCPLCPSKSYTEKTSGNGIFGPGGYSKVEYCICDGCSIIFNNPIKFMTRVGINNLYSKRIKDACDNFFITNNPRISGEISQLAFVFIRASESGDTELAGKMILEAKKLKDSVRK